MEKNKAATADVEGPVDEDTALVGVDGHWLCGIHADAFLSGLTACCNKPGTFNLPLETAESYVLMEE